MEVDEFDLAVEIFYQSRAAFNPIPAVQILHAVNHLHLRAMDVAADDAVGLMIPRHRGQRLLIFSDVFHGGLGLGLHIRRQRPVAKSKRPAQAVEIQIKIENPVVQV